MRRHFRKVHLMLLLLSCPLLQSQALLCPAPFSIQAGLCVFVSTAQSHSWCEANRQCASIGGELLNSYESVKMLKEKRIPSADCGCQLWVGLSDLADDRGVSRAGWQRVNGNGIFPTDDSLFNSRDYITDIHQNCLRSTASGLLKDHDCDLLYGFVCEFVGDARPPTAGIWIAAAFKRVQFNSEYCFTDILNVSSSLRCTAAAMRAGSSRHVLYNSKLRACRLLLFTDAQVEAEIETSADWVKFRLE